MYWTQDTHEKKVSHTVKETVCKLLLLLLLLFIIIVIITASAVKILTHRSSNIGEGRSHEDEAR